MNRQHNNFILDIFLTVALILAVVMSINAVIDPFRLTDLVDIKGFNHYKPSMNTRVRLMKSYEVRRRKPDAIVLGTSRSHIGIRASHPEWKKRAENPYNLSFDAAIPSEMYSYLVHAHTVSPLKSVLVGLETFHLAKRPVTKREDFDPTILGNNHRFVSFVRFLFSDFKILTSFDSLKKSRSTFAGRQSDGTSDWLLPSGQRDGEGYYRQSDAAFMKLGPARYFYDTDQKAVDSLMKNRILKKKMKIYPPQEEKKDPLTHVDYVRKIVEFCRQENIDLKFFITPAHAHQMEILKFSGQWASVEEGKMNLVKILAEEQALYPDKPPIPLYDFSGYSAITTEPLPPLGTLQEMKYYWESSHFKENVGDMILNILFGAEGNNDPMAKDFGVLLTSQNIESELAKIRRDQLAYEQNFPEDVKIIQKMLDDYKRKHDIRD